MVISSRKDPFSPRIGVLAFEIASTMSSLLSVHHMLSDPTILKLRSDIMRSPGVAYLNSTDQSLLIKQCCAELITDLDRAAESVSRHSYRYQSPFSTRIYTDLKSGSINPASLGIRLTSKSLEKRFKKLDKYIVTTSKLHDEMELLSELEARENKRFGRFSGPLLKEMNHISTAAHLEIKSQAQKVNKQKDESLWSQTYDKVLGYMMLACCSLFVRICLVFGPFVPGLPHMIMDKERHSGMFFSRLKIRVHPRSGFLERRSDYKEMPLSKSCPIPSAKELDIVAHWRGVLEGKAGTVGGSGLALRYANIIVLAKNMMMDENLEGERDELYGLIPDELNCCVRGKLRRWWRGRGKPDRDLAKGWEEAVWRILGWLGPVAHDTLMWEMERNIDSGKRFEGKGRTYLMQTLHFADKVKTEAAIVEVLVGLTMVCWYDGWNNK